MTIYHKEAILKAKIMILSMPEAEAYLQQFISQNRELKFPGDWGLKRTKHFLNLLQNPQNKLRVIHIAGTSGKGSTAIYISTILKSLGFKVGLHTSPYFVDFRERFKINGQLISEKSFCKYLNDIIPIIEKMKKTKLGKPTYFEILSVLAFCIFRKEKVRYAIIETGLGGLFDATNTVDSKSKLCVLTKIGHDHTKILGKTLEKIALQKAGIIQKGNSVLSIWQNASVRNVFEKQTRKKEGKLEYIKKAVTFENINLKNNKLVFDFNFKNYSLKNLDLETNASYQAENCALALSVVCTLSKRDGFPINITKIRKSLREKVLSGRMESIRIGQKMLILDGAHNPQKMKIFINSLKKAHPKTKFSFLVAFKKGKDYKKMLPHIIPMAKDIVLTSFEMTGQDLLHISENPETVAKNLRKLNFSNFKIVHHTNKAFRDFLKKTSDSLVITGSIYLLGKIYPLLSKNKRI